MERTDLTQSSGETSEPPSEPASEPQSASASPEQSNFQVLRARKHNHAFTVTKARFLPDDELHTIVISFDKEEGTKMTLTVDGEKIYQESTAGKFRGSAKLNVVGLVVDFSWDVIRIPQKFVFRTREFSFQTRAVGSSSSSSGSYGEQWKGHGHVYLLEILAV